MINIPLPYENVDVGRQLRELMPEYVIEVYRYITKSGGGGGLPKPLIGFTDSPVCPYTNLPGNPQTLLSHHLISRNAGQKQGCVGDVCSTRFPVLSPGGGNPDMKP